MYNVLNIPHKNIKLVDVELSGALLKQNNLMLNLRRSCDRCDKSFIKTGGLYKYKKNCKVMADIPKTKRQIQQIYDKNHPITNYSYNLKYHYLEYLRHFTQVDQILAISTV